MINLVLIVGTTSLSELKMARGLYQSIPNLQNINLTPFKDSYDITSICNIILFIPFGFLLPALWRRYSRFIPTFLYGLTFSIVIEVSQLFTMNRTCDINDVIFNTLGTVCGWIIFKLINKEFNKLFCKTMIDNNVNGVIIKLEPYLYVLIALVASFFQ